VLVRGEDLDVQGESTSRLIVAFTSPAEKEMWRKEGKLPMVQYVWRTSMVQLEPDLATVNNGGMGASVVAGALELRPYGAAVRESTTIKLDLARRVVDIERLITGLGDSGGDQSALGVSERTSTVRMRLMDLKCYRMPGESSKITSSP
jgi:hypothetical protein